MNMNNEISAYPNEYGECYDILYNNMRITLEIEETIELARLLVDTLSDCVTCNYDILYKHLDKIKHIKNNCSWIEDYSLEHKIDDEIFDAVYGDT